MIVTSEHHAFERIFVLDDDPAARSAYRFAIEDMKAQPVLEGGPLWDFEQAITKMTSNGNAAICDYHLRAKNYANFNGAQVVAALYKSSYPAILCTRFEKTQADEIRIHRRKVPVLITPSDMDSETLLSGFRVCQDEFDGNYLPSRRPWRTLIRVEGIEAPDNRSGGYFLAIVPAWSGSEGIKIYMDSVPESVQSQIKSGHMRFHAQVNLGAEKLEDLYFDEWEDQ
jgi:CheY-like chemotaxis protein